MNLRSLFPRPEYSPDTSPVAETRRLSAERLRREDAAREREYDRLDELRRDWREEAGVVPASPSLFALWLYVWKRNSNHEYRVHNFDAPPKYFEAVTRVPESLLPKGYGTQSMRLIVIEPWSSAMLRNPAFRRGEDYGHTEVYYLSVVRGMAVAQTNRDYVYTHLNVLETWEQVDMEALVKAYEKDPEGMAPLLLR